MLPSLEFLARQGYALFRPGWRPDRGGGSDGTLLLEPLAAADRPRIPGALNLIALPPERADDFF